MDRVCLQNKSYKPSIMDSNQGLIIQLNQIIQLTFKIYRKHNIELENNCGNTSDIRWAIHLYLHNGCHKILREKNVIKLLVCKLTINIGYWLTYDPNQVSYPLLTYSQCFFSCVFLEGKILSNLKRFSLNIIHAS